VSGKVHRDLKLENILLSKKEDDIENISIKVLTIYFSLFSAFVSLNNFQNRFYSLA